jgi:hypothetical protein
MTVFMHVAPPFIGAAKKAHVRPANHYVPAAAASIYITHTSWQ